MIVESESYDLVVFVQPIMTNKKETMSPENLSYTEYCLDVY